MCPDRKVKWFKDHGRNQRQTNEIKKRITKYWQTSYAKFKVTSNTNKSTAQSSSQIILIIHSFSIIYF